MSLWRYEPTQSVTLTPADHAALRAVADAGGWSQHLLQRGGTQRAYLDVAACDACSQERCAAGCRAVVIRTMLRRMGTLTPVLRGILPIAAHACTIALPTVNARPLDASILDGCGDAHLTVQWTRSQWIAVQVQTTSESPTVPQRLREHGWVPLRVPPVLAHRALTLASWAVLPALAWRGEPWVLTPCSERTKGVGDDAHAA